MDDLLLHGLQDIYYAENQIVKSLPKLIEKATNRDLAKGLRDHLSTPEQNCIGLPEQKYISDAGKKGPRTGGLFLRHHAWFGLSAGMSELARRELRLL
jgi:hypothetical protein